MFLGSMFKLFPLVMQGTVTLIPRRITKVMHQVLRIVRNSLRKYWILELLQKLPAFGLIGKLHPSLSVLFEAHDLQDLLEVELVRAENFQFPVDLHNRGPPTLVS